MSEQKAWLVRILLLLIALEVRGQPCTLGHCKLKFALVDSCDFCVTITTDISDIQPIDSIEYKISDTLGYYDAVRSEADTFCYQLPYTGQWYISVTVWETNSFGYKKGWTAVLMLEIDLTDCGCTTHSDCNDNNLCTKDECWQGQCRNQKSCANCNAQQLDWYMANCCCR